MALGRESSLLQRARVATRDRLQQVSRDRVLLAVVGVALIGFGFRLFALGERPTHWDEARVAYWALRYEETGAFAYTHIIHGPLIQHVDSFLFGLFGPSDFLARFPVAVVGTLLPLSALLYRRHLRGAETVALAVLLSMNGAVLYYSRFMRSDVLVATFMFVALGSLVRLYDTRRRRYLYAAALALALGIGSKENSVLYVATWLGALALVADTTLFRPRNATNGVVVLKAKANGLRESLNRYPALARRYLPHLIGAVIVLLVALLFLFAPRGEFVQYRPVGADELGTVSLWEGITQPTKFPEMVWNTATYGSEEYLAWTDTAGGGDEGGIFQKFDSYGRDWVELLAYYVAPVMVFAAFGFVYERYAAAESRSIVMFFTYAGVASVVGYPLAMDIFGAWNAVHVVVPLSVPAAVAVGTLVGWADEARSDRDMTSVALVVLVLLSGTVLLAVPAYQNVYAEPDSADNDLVQYGQPVMELRPTLTEMERAVAENEGTDLLVYGDEFVGDGRTQYYLPRCLGHSGWFDSLPLPWYYQSMDAEVTCAQNGTDLEEMETLPPVIVTHADNTGAFEDRLDEYDLSVHQIRTTTTPVAVFIEKDAAE